MISPPTPIISRPLSFFFFFNDTATTEIYTLSLHDALPISVFEMYDTSPENRRAMFGGGRRSEEHTSELQSPQNLVCRLLLEKKNARRGDERVLDDTAHVERATRAGRAC